MKRILATLLAVMLLAGACAGCGGGDDAAEAPAEEAPAAAPAAEPDAAAPDAAAPAAPAAPEGEASSEPSGEPSGEMQVEFYEPTDAYAKDFEGYRQYCIDGFLADQFHPEELEESTLAEFNSMTEADYASGDRIVALTDLGVILTYEEFLAY